MEILEKLQARKKELEANLKKGGETLEGYAKQAQTLNSQIRGLQDNLQRIIGGIAAVDEQIKFLNEPSNQSNQKDKIVELKPESNGKKK